jgi:hypothetical protein
MDYADSLWAHLGEINDSTDYDLTGTDPDVPTQEEVDEWLEKVLDQGEERALDEGEADQSSIDTTWNTAARRTALRRTASGEHEVIEAARRVMASGIYEIIDGHTIAQPQASALLGVYDAAADWNQDRLAALSTERLLRIALMGVRRTAADDEGGQTCAECGASIERDPEGEENRSWHHNDGDSHDHEAVPSGGDSKESRRTAGAPTITGRDSGPPPGTPQAEVDAYWNYVGQGAADSDSGWYVPLSFSSWRSGYWDDSKSNTTYSPGMPPMASSKRRRTASGDAIETARRIVANSAFETVDGMVLDLFSASAIVNVYDNLNPENQAKFASLGLPKMVDVAFKLLNRAKASSKIGGKAYDQGLKDGRDAIGIQYNPYNVLDPTDKNATEWIRGYRDAQGLQPGEKASSKVYIGNQEPQGGQPGDIWIHTAGEVPEQFKEHQKGDGDDDGDGKTCSECGDAIAQTDGDWHHDNGEKHDHEAKPGGGSKESRFRAVAGFGSDWADTVVDAYGDSRFLKGPTRAPDGVRQDLWDAAGENAALGVGHIWTNTKCPAYKTFDPNDCTCSSKESAKTAATGSELRAQNSDLFTGADAAYDRRDQGWFDALSMDDLAVLWDSVSGENMIDMQGSWDDEVYEALYAKGYFPDEGEARTSVKTAGRIEDLVRRMEQAEDFGYDDEEVELNEILRGRGQNWLWGPGDRVQIVSQEEFDRIKAERTNGGIS